jgi:hypothetical protein
LLDEGAILIADRLQHALHTRHQVDRLDRRGIAGGFEVARDVALHRHRNVDRRRRRRHEGVLFAAAQQQERRHHGSGAGGAGHAAVATVKLCGDRLMPWLHPTAPMD